MCKQSNKYADVALSVPTVYVNNTPVCVGIGIVLYMYNVQHGNERI